MSSTIIQNLEKMLASGKDGAGRQADALGTYRQGIAVAEGKGDKQAAKEMSVFAKRLEKALGSM